jgi:hypothetical protein
MIIALLAIVIGILIVVIHPSITATQSLGVDLSSPFLGVDFPLQAINYPTAWPVEIRYPDQFLLVDASSAQLPDIGKYGWSAQLRFLGSIEDAYDQLIKFYDAHGWKVTEYPQMNTSTRMLLLQKNETQSGIVVLDIDRTNPRSVLIIASLSD